MRYGRLMAMAIVFASSPFAPAALAQQNANQSQKWEYKVVNYCAPENRSLDEREHIQRLGEEGWELVSTDSQFVNEAARCLVHYFKRPKGAESKQITKQQSQCSIPLDKAPTIRGLRLGMSADELLSLFAANDMSKRQVEAALKNAGLAPNYGLTTFTLSPRDSTMMEVKERFVGVSFFRFTTFDGRVVEIQVNYERGDPSLYPSWTIDELTAKVSFAFGLPRANYWEPPSSDDQRKLKCKGFEVEAAINPPVYNALPVLGIYRTPSLTITDPSYLQVLDQRVKSDQATKQREFVF
jgi:Domain of unknown function (DUF4177)